MYKVIIVDDEPIIVEGLKLGIEWANWNCEIAGTASNGLAGLELMRKIKPDILISDISMNNMDGLAMVAAIKSEYPDIEVCLLTGFRNFEYAQQAIKLDNNDVHKGSLILVNKAYPSYVDGEDAVSLYDYKTNTYTVADTNVMINKSIVDTTNKMFDDFYSIYGESDLYIACAYRSYATQEGLYQDELNSDPEAGVNLVAPPGYSDHQTGYVFDVDHYNATEKNGIAFDGTGNDEWFLNNCANYGFIVRYPEDKVDITGYYYEPWHYRYVGIPHAIYMKQNNLCLEEYLDKIKNNTKDNPLTVSAEDGTTWSMWYEKAYEDGDVTQIAIPKDCDYEISGNNVDGFIITVKSK